MAGQPQYYRRVFRIRAEDSPNVRLATAQIARGEKPTNEILVPGVLTWELYQLRRSTWDKIRQTIGLDALFYEGAELLLFPPDWLDFSEGLAAQYDLDNSWGKAECIGIDVAQGGDDTAMAAVNRKGLVDLRWKKTPDTSVIPQDALDFADHHGLSYDKIWFDLGGGGKQHVDYMRKRGWRVNGVSFGESIAKRPRRGLAKVEERVDVVEERLAYTNRRAEMYGMFRIAIDPARERERETLGIGSFAIPGEYTMLREELAPMPLLYDNEQRMRMLPKTKKDSESDEKTLTELIGWSPDRADAVVVAFYGMNYRGSISGIGSPKRGMSRAGNTRSNGRVR